VVNTKRLSVVKYTPVNDKHEKKHEDKEEIGSGGIYY